MDVFNPLDALVVNLGHQVFFSDLLPELLCAMHSLKPFTFLQCGCVHILFLGQREVEDAVEQPLQKLVEFFLLVAQKGLIDDIGHEFLLQDDQ